MRGGRGGKQEEEKKKEERIFHPSRHDASSNKFVSILAPRLWHPLQLRHFSPRKEKGRKKGGKWGKRKKKGNRNAELRMQS